MIADQVNVWLGTAVTAALAIFGFGAMSLALGRMVGCAASLVLLIRLSPQPFRLGFDPAKARALVKFGLPLAGSGVILFAVANVDQLVVGRVLGVTALGFFALASNLSNWPVAIFSQPVRNVAPAAFSRLQHDPAAMRTGFLSVAELLGAVTLPVCLVIGGAAVPLIGLVYGTQWLPAAQVLIWLAALSALQIFFELTYDFFVVLGKARVVLTLQLAWVVVLIPALVAGARVGGISGLAMAEAAVAAGLVLPWYVIELHKAGVRWRDLAARLWAPLTGAALAAGLAAGAAQFVPNDLMALIAGAMAGVLVIGLLLYYLRSAIASLRQLTGNHEGRSAATPAAGIAAPAADSDVAGAIGEVRYPAAALLPIPPDVWLSRPADIDTTGPLPLCREFAATFPALRDTDNVQVPLYQATVASLQWDPAASTN